MSAPPDWEDIRRAYDDHSITIAKIIETFGITASQLTARRLAGQWTARQSAAARAKASADAKRALSASSDGRAELPEAQLKPPAKLTPIAQRRALVVGLTNAIETKLKLLERRFQREMDGKTPASAADFERDTRNIGLLFKNLEQVTEYDHAHTLGRRITGAAAKSAALASTALADEADRLRSELAARLQRFIDAATGGAPGASTSDRTGEVD